MPSLLRSANEIRRALAPMIAIHAAAILSQVVPHRGVRRFRNSTNGSPVLSIRSDLFSLINNSSPLSS